MQCKLVSGFMLSTLLAFATTLPLQAQAPVASPPAIAFQLADQSTVHQSAGIVAVAVSLSDPAGLSSSSTSGAYCSSSSSYSSAPTSASITMWFFVSYFPTGDYTFTASATDTNGSKTSSQITLHLVP